MARDFFILQSDFSRKWAACSQGYIKSFAFPVSNRETFPYSIRITSANRSNPKKVLPNVKICIDMKKVRLSKTGWIVLLWMGLFSPFILNAQNFDDTGALDPVIDESNDDVVVFAAVGTEGSGDIDAQFSLKGSETTATSWSQFAAILRFIDGQPLDARDAGSYTFDEEVAFDFSEYYYIWMVVHFATQTYDVYVQPVSDGTTYAIGENYGWRSSGDLTIPAVDTWVASNNNEASNLVVDTVRYVDAVGDLPDGFSDTSLETIEVSTGVLDPAFATETTSYDVTVPSGTSTVTVNAIPNSPYARVTGDGEVEVSSPTVIEVAAGGATESYTINWIVEDAAADATLADLVPDAGTLEPGFNPAITEYSIAAPYLTETVTLTTTASADGATISGNDPLDVSSGSGILEVTVTSEDESATTTYTVDVTVDEFMLTSIEAGGVKFDDAEVTATISHLDPTATAYTVSLPSGTVAGYIASATTNDPNAFIEHSTDTVDLSDGSVTLPLTVTSENLESSITVQVTLEVPPAVYNTSTGTFDPVLDGTDHVVYSRIDITSNGVAIDGLFAFSNGVVGDWGHTSGGLRFEEGTGLVQLRDGGDYLPEPNTGFDGDTVTVEYDTTYHCWLVLSPADTMYSAYVQIEGAASPTLIGEDARFRFQTNMIDRWTALSLRGADQGLNVRRVEMVDNVGDIPTLGTNADLSGISLEYGSLDPAFDPAVTTYDVDVPFGTESLWVEGTLADQWAYIEGDGEVTIDTGAGTAELIVKAEDTIVFKTYTINFTELAENTDATLSTLTTDVGELNPVFSSAVTSYTLQVPYATTTVNLDATTNVAGATVAGDGAIDVSAGGTFPVDVTVTAADGETTKTYTVTIETGPAGTDATLAFLKVDAGTLTPEFSSDMTAYEVEVPFGTETVKVTYKPVDLNATVSVTSDGVVAVTQGDVTVAEIEVTAQDGSTTETYSIDITVTPPSTDASLASLEVAADGAEIAPAFDPEVFAYTLDVPYGNDEVQVTAAANHIGATVAGDGTIDVSSGSATATITVTAESEDVQTYTIEVTVLEASTDATLKSLSVENEGSTFEPTFDPGVFEYVAEVPLGTNTATILAETTFYRASVTGAGALDVISGSGTANIVVTAEDGETTNTYVIEIYVGAKPDPEVLSAGDELSESISVYPNPVSQFLTVDLGTNPVKGESITIINAGGQVMKVKKELDGELLRVDVTSLPEGMYFLKLQAEGSSITRRFIKVN